MIRRFRHDVQRYATRAVGLPEDRGETHIGGNELQLSDWRVEDLEDVPLLLAAFRVPHTRILETVSHPSRKLAMNRSAKSPCAWHADLGSAAAPLPGYLLETCEWCLTPL